MVKVSAVGNIFHVISFYPKSSYRFIVNETFFMCSNI